MSELAALLTFAGTLGMTEGGRKAKYSSYHQSNNGHPRNGNSTPEKGHIHEIYKIDVNSNRLRI